MPRHAPRLVFVSLLLGGAALAAACSDGGGTPTRTAPDEPVTEITISSESTDFDIEEFQVPVGEEVTVTYENKDEGVVHNLNVTDVDDAATDLEAGEVTQELTFTIDEPGTYDYVCDAHRAAMKGTITAVEG